jgi:hypothetical protein
VSGPGPGVLVWDTQTGQQTYIPLADYAEAIAGGRFRAYDQSVVRSARAGATVEQSPEDALRRREPFVSAAGAEAEAAAAAREAAFDNLADKAFTAVEGAVDTATFGALKVRGEIEDARRSELSGYATAGSVGAIATSFLVPGATGPLLGGLAKGSTRLGSAVSKSLVRESAKEVAGRGALRGIARRAVDEAAQGAAYTAAMGAGNAAVDAIIEDKPFAAEHLAAAIGEDVMLGLGVGAGVGTLGAMFRGARSRRRARKWITGQGGVLDATSAESARIDSAVSDAVAGWDAALAKHQTVSSSLDTAVRSGEGGAGASTWATERRAAISTAQKLRARLATYDIPKAIAGDDVAAHSALLGYRKGDTWVPGLIDSYADAVGKLDGYGPTAGMDEWAASRRRYAGISAQVDEAEAYVRGMPDDAGTTARTGEAPDGTYADLTHAEPISDFKSMNDSGVDYGRSAGSTDNTAVGKVAARTPTSPSGPRDLNAPRIDPSTSKSQLAAFAHDVQQLAANVSNPSVDNLWHAMYRRGGKAPGGKAALAKGGGGALTIERFQELLAEAEHAGYLMTTGERVHDVAHMGMKIGDSVAVPADMGPGDFAWSKKERFRWEDRGKRAGMFKGADGTMKPVQTVVDGSVPTGAPDASGSAPSLSDVPRSAEPSMEPAPDMGPDQAFMDSVDAMEAFSGVTPSPIEPLGARASERVQALLDEIHQVTDGRIGKAAALDAAEAAGLASGPRGALSEALAGVVGLRNLARALGDAASGGTAKQGPRHSRLLSRMGVRAGSSMARQMINGGNIGRAGIAGAAGALGGHLVGAALGVAGGVAVSVGAARSAIVEAGAALLAGKGSRVVSAVALNAKYGYGDGEPTEDVAERVQQLHTALANPEAIRAQAMDRLGDLALLAPDVAEAAVANHIRLHANLATKAPRFVWDAMGKARPVGAQALRRFREAEDATWNMPALLRGIGSGKVTSTQAEMFQVQFPMAHAELVRSLLADRDGVGRASREVKLAVERITGIPLTKTNATYASRQQPQPPPAPSPTQSMNIQAPAPTPAQAAMAPGNQ